MSLKKTHHEQNVTGENVKQTKHNMTIYHTDKLSQEKTPQRQNITGENATGTKCHRAKRHTEKMSQDRMLHGQNLTGQKATHIKRRWSKISQDQISKRQKNVRGQYDIWTKCHMTNRCMGKMSKDRI